MGQSMDAYASGGPAYSDRSGIRDNCPGLAKRKAKRKAAKAARRKNRDTK